MHKSTILALSLISMLFLAATTGMSMQVSALEETEKLQSFLGSKKHDDKSSSKHPSQDQKFECKTGPFKGFYVADQSACNVDIPADPELLCKECIKYWLNFLNNLPADNPQTLILINSLANAINHKNFNFGPQQTCERVGVKVNPLHGVECLPVVQSNNIDNSAQVFEICKQLDLALRYLDDSKPNTNPLQALVQIGRGVVNFQGTDQTIDKVLIGLFVCFAESLFPSSQQSIRTSQESAIVQQDNQENTVVEQQSIDQQQQQQIEQIKQQIQQSLGQEKQQQQSTQQKDPSSISQEESSSIQQNNDKPSSSSSILEKLEQNKDKPSSVSQEEMHEQQIANLKALLAATR